ncbi:MAG: LysM peptidoglycan-binding domain-containing protein [Planctomycetota bacterium]
MNASYKIVLLGAFVLFAAVVGYYIFSGDSKTADELALNDEYPAERGSDDDTPSAGPMIDEPEHTREPEPEPRPTLETPAVEETPVPDETTIGETTEELPEAPVFEPIPDGTLAEADLPSDPVRPAPGTEGSPVTEDPGTTTEETTDPELEPRPAPEPDTGDPSEGTPEPEPVVEPEPEVEPAPRPVPPDPATVPRTYTVQAGDTFASIAQEFYGEERAWFDIAQANPSVDPKRLQVGQEIVLPNRDPGVREREEVRPPAPGNDQNYTVRPGDNLSKIAQKFYGEAEKWDLIYARNRQLIGPRPDALRVGMELVIPQAYDGAE